MEVVAGVVEWKKHAGVRGVGRYFVEVDDAVELAGGADPFVNGLSYLLAGGRLILCADEGRQGRTDDFDSVSVGAGGELAEADDEVIGGDDVVGVAGVCGVADVVDALHDDDVFDAGLGEDVTVEAGEGRGTGSVVENAVAADASLRTPRLAVFLFACRRRKRTSGQRALASRVLWAPSVMLSPKVTMEAPLLSEMTSTPFRKSQLKNGVEVSSEAAATALPGTR